MPNPNHTAITMQAQTGLRRNATLVAGSVAGASVIATLAVASVAPLLAGGLAPAAIIAWLSGLGGNALANWLDQWARDNLSRWDGQDPDYEQRLFTQMAHDLQAVLGGNTALTADIELLVQQIDAIPVALEALKGQGAQQLRLLELLLQDVQSARVENNQLHDATYRMIRERTQAILDAQAQADSAFADQLRTVLETVRRIETANKSAPTTTMGGISIGGSVGNMQQVNVSGTMSAPIIGSQHNYYAAQSVPGQDAIEDAESDLVIQRQHAAKARRRVAQGDASANQSLTQACAEIHRLKAQLRGWGRTVRDEPGDDANRS